VFYHLSHTPALFVFVIFLNIVLHLWLDLDHEPPIYYSCVAETAGIHHQAQLLLVEMRYLETPSPLASQAGCELNPPNLCSQVVRITGMRHQCPAKTVLKIKPCDKKAGL
jgi:hypothetical protein